MDLITIIKYALITSVFLTALGNGLKTPPAEAFSLFRSPGQLLRSLVSMHIIMPLFAILLALFSGLPVLIKVTLIAISLSPLPPLFPRRPLKAGGRHAYITGLMVAVSLLSIMIIPLTLEILAQVMDKPVYFSTKAIAGTLAVTILLPLFLGIGFRYFATVLAEKLAGPVATFALILLLISVLPVLYALFPEVIHLVGNGTVLALLAFVVVGLMAGHFLGGPAREDRTVLAFATAARHPGVALAVASANLPDQKQVAAAVVLYLIINAMVTVPYLKWLKP